MTAALALQPTLGHPGVVVAAVHGALDGFDADAAVAAEDYGALVAECARARTRLQALELRLVAAADRARVAAVSGARDTAAWLAVQTRGGAAQAARDARLATDLADRLPTTGAALETGQVSTAHARVIAHAMGQLPAGIGPVERERVETCLAEQARELDPTALRRAARCALAAVESDPTVVDAHEDAQLVDEEARARARTRLTLHDNADGTTTGHFTIPTLAASVLAKVLGAMTSPRRASLGVGHAQGGDQGTRRDPAHERGVAFAHLMERLPTDRLHSKTAATIVVTLDHDHLLGQVKPAGLDTGERVSGGEARRLACGAGILPAVLDGASVPVDLGRQKRFFNGAQQALGATKWTRCAARGCTIPYAWCELHHQQPWSRGGPTDFEQMEPHCSFHHHRIHDPAYRHRRHPDGSVTFHRRT